MFTFLSIVHVILGVASMFVARRARKRIFRGEQHMRTDTNLSLSYSNDHDPDRTPRYLLLGFTGHLHSPGILYSILLGLWLELLWASSS